MVVFLTNNLLINNNQKMIQLINVKNRFHETKFALLMV